MARRRPYFVKVRRYEQASGIRRVGKIYGDPDHPVEGLFTTDQGAINVKVWLQGDTEIVTVKLMPWPDEKGTKRGIALHLYHGPISGPTD